MGGDSGEGDDSQKLKRIAAAAYEYDNDPRWVEHWGNVLIPPHLTSRTDVVDHFKRKFYQRYIDPGLIVEPMVSSSASQRTKSEPSPSSFSSSPTPDTQGQSSGTPSRTSATFTTTTNTPFRLDQQTIRFSINAWVLLVAIVAIFPSVPSKVSNRAYRICFLGTSFYSLYTVYALHGLPRGLNSQALLMWFQSVAVTKDFIFFMYCIVFAPTSPCFKFALLPVLCHNLEQVVKFSRRNFGGSSLYRKYLERAFLWVDSHTATLDALSSKAEIGLGFLLLISLLSWQRNIIQAFMYWQVLKLVYHAPATASYHQDTWADIGKTVNPLVGRYAPILKTPLYAIQKWWTR